MQVDYPNRRLGMRHALSGVDAAFDPNAWAQVALANLRVGETVAFENGMATVMSISDQQLRLKTPDGTSASLSTFGPRFERLVRDLGGLLLARMHGSDRTGDAWSALCRDPAWVSSGGVPFLSDVGALSAASHPCAPEMNSRPEFSPTKGQDVVVTFLRDGQKVSHSCTIVIVQQDGAVFAVSDGRGFNKRIELKDVEDGTIKVACAKPGDAAAPRPATSAKRKMRP